MSILISCNNPITILFMFTFIAFTVSFFLHTFHFVTYPFPVSFHSVHVCLFASIVLFVCKHTFHACKRLLLCQHILRWSWFLQRDQWHYDGRLMGVWLEEVTAGCIAFCNLTAKRQTFGITRAVCLQLRANGKARQRRGEKEPFPYHSITVSGKPFSMQTVKPSRCLLPKHDKPQECTQLPVRTYLSPKGCTVTWKALFWIISPRVETYVPCVHICAWKLTESPWDLCRDASEAEQMRDRWCRWVLPDSEPESSLYHLGTYNKPPRPMTQGPGCRVEPSTHGEEFNVTKHTFKSSANHLAGMRAALVRVWCWQHRVWCNAIFRMAFKNLALAPYATC